MRLAGLLALAAVALLLNPLPAIGSQTDNVNESTNPVRREGGLERDHFPQHQRNVYLIVSVDDDILSTIPLKKILSSGENEATGRRLLHDHVWHTVRQDDWKALFEKAREECYWRPRSVLPVRINSAETGHVFLCEVNEPFLNINRYVPISEFKEIPR